MARLFVFSDNLAARVEIGRDANDVPEVICAGCNTNLWPEATEDTPEADLTNEAAIHADRCRRCADDDCYAIRPHDAGHRCRKP